MILIRHLTKLLGATFAYGVSTRRVALLALVVLGFVLVAVTTATQVVAPVIVYPFV